MSDARHVRVRVPGKVMLAGEYAVLAPGGVAVALAVPRHLVVEAAPAAASEVTSALLGFARRPAGEGTGDRFVDAALAAARAALADVGRAERPLHLTVTSALSAPGRPKGGLGSSAAVTVGVIGALLAAHGVALDGGEGRARLLGLALAAHLGAQGFRGSGYDVATCVLGGVALVRAPADQPLAAQAGRLVAAGQPAAVVARALAAALGTLRAAWPSDVHAVLVASGQSASTPALVSAARAVDPAPLGAAAEQVVAALATGSGVALLAAVDAAEEAFERWDRDHSLGLVTPALAALAADARAAGLVPRVSGAGGGDSLLALGGDPVAVGACAARWAAEGRAVLPVTVDADGALLL